MYTVCVRGHMMVAHSFRGELFGPAQRLHGATYVVDVELRCKELGPDGVVVDIGRAQQALDAVLKQLNFRNLDEEPAFSGQNTTTEFLSRALFERLRGRIVAGEFGPGSAELESMRVTLHESHVAWASFEDRLRP
jgi:6-pyruvoyltetrahydropterin/6-carboxytetrahydropterin synthase